MDIHALIAGADRRHDLHALVDKHEALIEGHLETCEACSRQMVGLAHRLPRYRTRMTVSVLEAKGWREFHGQLNQLKLGQCLPCGCEVIATPWSQDHARSECYGALARVAGITEEEVRVFSEKVPFAELPIEIKTLRRLRDEFWIPSGSHASPDMRDREEGGVVLQLPATLEGFIARVMEIHSNATYSPCDRHS